MPNPVTWPEVSAALGDGEARKVAEEHWEYIDSDPEPLHTFGEYWGSVWIGTEPVGDRMLIDCLVRAELCLLWKAADDVGYQFDRERAGAIRAVRERLEQEVYGD